MLRIAPSNVNGRLIRNTFCYESEVAPVQRKRALSLIRFIGPICIIYSFQYDLLLLLVFLFRAPIQQGHISPGVDGTITTM